MNDHKLTVNTIKTRDEHEGVCSCGGWAVAVSSKFGGATAAIYRGHELHVQQRANRGA
jgi:hypothetical protein